MAPEEPPAIPPEPPAPPAGPAGGGPAAEPAPAGERRTCPRCRSEVRASARFCTSCGRPLLPIGERMRLFKREQEAFARDFERGQAGAWASVRGVIAFYAVYLSTTLPIAWLADAERPAGLMIASWIDAGIILLFAWRLRASLPFRRAPDSRIGRLLAGLAAGLPVLLAINIGYHEILRRGFGVDAPRLTEFFRQAGHGPLATAFAICVMPAFWEEIAFRGVILGGLKKAIGAREANLLTALLFAIIHQAFLSLPVLFLLGWFLGRLREKSGSLWPGMAFHFLHNLAILGWEWSGG